MEEKICYNALAIAVRSNYKKLKALKERHKTWANAWNRFSKNETLTVNPEREWQVLENTGIQLIVEGDDNYPKLLSEIPHPPLGIYFLGQIPDSGKFPIAIVGTRKSTGAGNDLARKLAAELSGIGATIISGLALGVDAMSHRGALESRGKTIGVLGNGLGLIYPKVNERLAKDILDNKGTILSEYPPKTPPLPYQFLERNRIISGMSAGIIVIEAPEKSGSLVTARFALEQNREVFVVPGPVNHPNFRGSHELIKSGATLITESNDIIKIMAPGLNIELEIDKPITNISPVADKIIKALLRSSKPTTIDKIAETTKLDIQTVNSNITLLIADNIIRESAGNYELI